MIGALLALTVVLPPIDVPADYQLGGAYAPPPGVGVVARDWRESPAPGTYGICYINGFQTQPEQRSWWLAKHPGLVLRRDGKPVFDPGWPGEMLLDTRTPAKRKRIASIMEPWMRSCAQRGYRAIEADNLDSWTRSRGLLSAKDNVSHARRLADVAHDQGLAFAQKNAASLTGRSFFDFAIVEQCQRYQECDRFLNAYDDRVIEIEYRRRDFVEACRDHGDRVSVVLRDVALREPGRRGYRYASC
ncbi:MAG: endo alpha-1,4 polygalactosaminidase [Candidatus Nanopelagicales bacterium]|nr:endo alpha-1,4 polygalactosaminidase [Candidatus Nanopelagicales bacterium]